MVIGNYFSSNYKKLSFFGLVRLAPNDFDRFKRQEDEVWTMKKKAAFLIGALFVLGGLIYLQIPSESHVEEEGELRTFSSEAELIEYLQEDDTRYADTAEAAGAVEEDAVEHAESDVPTEVSDGEETFRQVSGIQEPATAKLGDSLYYSPTVYRSEINTTVLETPELEIEENISEEGELILLDELLLVIGDEALTAYDLDSYEVEWGKDIGEYAEDGKDSRVVTTRAFEDRLFLLLDTSIDYDSPCPYVPMEGVRVPCYDIAYPGYSTEADRAYTALNLDFDGEVQEEASFVGDRSTEAYITENSVYVTYGQQEETSEIIMDFLLDYASIPSELEDRIVEIQGYDLSDRSVMIETERAITEKLTEEEMEDLEEEMEAYTEERKREVEETSIVRFDEDLEERYVVEVPGNVRDRMDLHERNGKLYGLTRISSHSALSHFSPFYDFFVIEEGEVEDYDEKFVDTRWSNTEVHEGKIFISRQETKIYGIEDRELLETLDLSSVSVHPLSEGFFVVGQNEDWETVLLRLDENLEEEHRKVIEDDRYRAGGEVQVDSSLGKAIITGHGRSFVANLTEEEFEVEKINASGRLSFITEDYIYIVGRGEVKAFDGELEDYSSFKVPETSLDEVERRLIEELEERDIAADVSEL